jgi:hypothetical protein
MFSFELSPVPYRALRVDPWPEYWGSDWYDNDDVYVVYVDNGYYLYNRRYPNIGIAIRGWVNAGIMRETELGRLTPGRQASLTALYKGVLFKRVRRLLW